MHKINTSDMDFNFIWIDLNTIEKWLKEKKFRITLENIFGPNPLKNIKKMCKRNASNESSL